MSWGESQSERITVLCCGVEGCGHKMLGNAMSPRFCPTHDTPLAVVLYELVKSPPLAKKAADDPK